MTRIFVAILAVVLLAVAAGKRPIDREGPWNGRSKYLDEEPSNELPFDTVVSTSTNETNKQNETETSPLDYLKDKEFVKKLIDLACYIAFSSPGGRQQCIKLADMALESKGFVRCQFCEVAVTLVKKKLQDKDFVEKIRKGFLWVCNIMPISEERCQQLYNMYIYEVILLIEDNLEPKALCKMIGLCDAKKEFRSHGPVVLWPI